MNRHLRKPGLAIESTDLPRNPDRLHTHKTPDKASLPCRGKGGESACKTLSMLPLRLYLAVGLRFAFNLDLEEEIKILFRDATMTLGALRPLRQPSNTKFLQ